MFTKVWNNIILLNESAPNIYVTIRVNLTQENSNEYVPLFKLFCETFNGRHNIAIAPAFVLDRGTIDCKLCNKKNNLFNHKDRSLFILELAKAGIFTPFLKYPEPFFNECAIRNNVAISFDPDGYAYKCWEVIGNKEYAIGRLDNDGNIIEINEKVINRQLYGADPLDNPICSACKYLPICNGGCPIQRIENEFLDGKNNVCTYYKGYLKEFLKFNISIENGMR